MLKEKFVKVCPKCGSVDYHKESDLSFLAAGSGFFVCNNCGYSAQFFPEVTIDKLGKFRLNIKKEEKPGKTIKKESAPAV